MHHMEIHFKLLLNRIQKLIGSIRVPCTINFRLENQDDPSLLAKFKSDMQAMVWVTENSASRERYCIHPTKSHTLFFYYGRKRDSEFQILLDLTCFDITDSAVHLHHENTPI